MLPAMVVVYVGDAGRAMDVGAVLHRRFGRGVQLLAADPDDVRALVADDRPDCLVCGAGLDQAQVQTVVDTVADAGATGLPVFDLSREVAAVPQTVEVTHLYPGTDPNEAADELVRGMLEASVVPEGVDAPDSAAGTAGDGGTTAVAAPTVAPRGADRVLAVREDWSVIDWDPRLADWFGVGPAEAIGAELWSIVDETVEADLAGHLREAMETDAPATETVALSETDRRVEVRAVPTGDGTLECYLRDVTERAALETELAETSRRFEDTVDRVTDAFFALDTDEHIEFLNERAEAVFDVDAAEVEDERFWDVFPAAVSTTFYEEFNRAMDTQESTSFREYYRPQDAWFEVTAYPSEEGLSVFLRDVTEQVRLRKRLEDLHDVTQRLIVAESDAAIGEEAVDAAADLLELPLTVVWRYDRTREVLEPLAWTDEVAARTEDVQPITPDDDLAWEVYEAGEAREIESVPVTTPNSHRPGEVGAELLVPLGEFGVFGTYGTESAAFDEADVELFHVLGTAVESALTRAQRERELARRNERLNDFASVVSHDLRNPLQIADARTELAIETGDTDHLEKVADAIDRMDELIDDLLDRARGDQELERTTLSLERAARQAWDGVDTADATLEVVAEARLSADSTRLTQLFENLFRNAVEHGSEDVTVTVRPTDEGFVVGDDGPGIPEAQRDSVLEQGVTEADEGTGFGLAIVTDIVEGHGWSIDVDESEAGGAAIEIGHVFSMERD